jgi:hypothetical protein
MRSLAIWFFALLILSGCTGRVPEPVNHGFSEQKKMQASEHWEVLAADLANRINNEMILSGNIEKAVYVKETCGDEATPCSQNETSPFNEAFRDLLITNLYNYGIPTNSSVSTDAVEVLYKVQLVRYRANRVRTPPPGIFTALSTAIVVLRNAPSEILIMAGGVTADLLNVSATNKGQHEIIITTSLIDNNEYLFRASDIYYINDKDSWHYKESMPTTKTIQLSSKRSTSEY